MSAAVIGDLAIHLALSTQGMDDAVSKVKSSLGGLDGALGGKGEGGGGILGGLKDTLEKISPAMQAIKGVLHLAQVPLKTLEIGFNLVAKAADLAASGVKSLAAHLLDFIRYSIKVGTEFEHEMSKTASITRATADEFEMLRETARRLGRDTEFTAAQAAEAMFVLAMHGLKARQVWESVDDTLNLARVGQMELADAADLVGVSLSAFNLKAEEAGRVVDAISVAATNSATHVKDMAVAFQYALPAMGTTGRSIEETATALAMMARFGIRGSIAGTALRNIIFKMARPTAEAKEALADLGIAFFDAQGNAKELSVILHEITQKTKHLNQQEKLEFFGIQFEKRAAAAVVALEAMGGTSVEKFQAMIKDSAGRAAEIGKEYIDNVWGAGFILESAIQGLAENLFSAFQKEMKEGLLELAATINQISIALRPVFAEAVSSIVRTLDYVLAGPGERLRGWLAEMGQRLIPVVSAAWGAFAAAVGAGAQGLVSIGEWFAGGQWMLDTEGLVRAFHAVEFFFKNFDDIVRHTFFVNIPKALEWFADKFVEINKAILRGAAMMMFQLGRMIARGMKEIVLSIGRGGEIDLAELVKFDPEAIAKAMNLKEVFKDFPEMGLPPGMGKAWDEFRKLKKEAEEFDKNHALRQKAIAGFWKGRPMLFEDDHLRKPPGPPEPRDLAAMKQTVPLLLAGTKDAASAIARFRLGGTPREKEQLDLQRRQAAAAEKAARLLDEINRKDGGVVAEI